MSTGKTIGLVAFPGRARVQRKSPTAAAAKMPIPKSLFFCAVGGGGGGGSVDIAS